MIDPILEIAQNDVRLIGRSEFFRDFRQIQRIEDAIVGLGFRAKRCEIIGAI